MVKHIQLIGFNMAMTILNYYYFYNASNYPKIFFCVLGKMYLPKKKEKAYVSPIMNKIQDKHTHIHSVKGGDYEG